MLSEALRPDLYELHTRNRIKGKDEHPPSPLLPFYRGLVQEGKGGALWVRIEKAGKHARRICTRR